jgi:plasmid stabilization system protein ParE
MNCRVTRRADRDIDGIWDFIARDSFDNADKVDREIHQAIRLLSEFPNIGHHRDDVTNPNYRFWSVYKYLIAYRVRGRTVTIVRVIHGARNVRRLFK